MRKHLLLAGLVLLLAAPLVLILRDFTRNVIVVQLLRALWVGRILFESIPQLPFWILFLVISVLIAVRSLIKGKKPVPVAPEAEVDRPGQIQFLARRIGRATQGEYFKWSLALYLRELVLETLAHQERTTREQVRQRLAAGRLDAPPEVWANLQAEQMPVFSRHADIFSVLKHRLRSSTRSAALDPDLENIVQFLEDQLEVQHGQ